MKLPLNILNCVPFYLRNSTFSTNFNLEGKVKQVSKDEKLRLHCCGTSPFSKILHSLIAETAETFKTLKIAKTAETSANANAA